MFFQDFIAERIYLALRKSLKTCTFKTELKSSDAREKGDKTDIIFFLVN
jgi:hypothetical protein